MESICGSSLHFSVVHVPLIEQRNYDARFVKAFLMRTILVMYIN